MGRAPGDERPTSRGALLLALAVSLVVSQLVPFGAVLLYPFTLLASWVHEMGHGVAALVVGGRFESLDVYADASGLAFTSWPSEAAHGVVSLGGLLAPSLVGVVVFVAARGPRRARTILGVLAALLIASLVLWVRSVAGIAAMPIVAALLAAFAIWGSPRERMFLAQFVGLRLAFDTLTRGLDYLWTDSVEIQGQTRVSDIASVASSFGGPRVVWSLIVSIVCLALVATGLAAAWWTPRASRIGLPR